MAGVKKVIVDLPIRDGAHGLQVSAAMRRVGELCGRIAAGAGQDWYSLGRAIADAESAVEGTNYAEVEFASYLAGLAIREG
jgi:hypothetical protein